MIRNSNVKSFFCNKKKISAEVKHWRNGCYVWAILPPIMGIPHEPITMGWAGVFFPKLSFIQLNHHGHQWSLLKFYGGHLSFRSLFNYTIVKVDGATPKRWLSKGPWWTNTWELRHLLSRWYNGKAWWFGARWFGLQNDPLMKGMGILRGTPQNNAKPNYQFTYEKPPKTNGWESESQAHFRRGKTSPKHQFFWVKLLGFRGVVDV